MRLDLLSKIVERVPFPDHGGMSGAELERARLHDGSWLVLKRSSPHTDVVMQLLGDNVSREVRLWERGVLRDLPSEVGHVVVCGWVEGDVSVVVMRDLGGRVVGREAHLTLRELRRMLTAVHALHRHRYCDPPSNLAPLDAVINTFAPERLAAVRDPANPLVARALRGWSILENIVERGVGRELLSLARDPAALVDAIARRPLTMCHGDVAAVNMAWAGEQLVLIDWGGAVAAPGELDIARFLPDGLRSADLSRDSFLGEYRAIAGNRYDTRAMKLSLLATFVWFGWSMALDAVEEPDSVRRMQAQVDLAWWTNRAREALDEEL